MSEKSDPINWNSTRELQVIACMACWLYNKREKLEVIDKEQFHKELFHHYPEWRKQIPNWVDYSTTHLDERVYQKGYNMNKIAKQHPVHIRNASTIGRYWDAVCHHMNNPLGTTPKGSAIQKLIDTVPPSILGETPEEIDQIFTNLSNLRRALDVYEIGLRKALGVLPS